MINRRQSIFYYFEIAGRIAVNRMDRRSYFLGAIGIRNDGALVHASNSSSMDQLHATHAERKLCRKLDFGAIVYVARVRCGDGKFGLAKPCYKCEAVLRAKKVRRVYYTITNNEYGVLIL